MTSVVTILRFYLFLHNIQFYLFLRNILYGQFRDGGTIVARMLKKAPLILQSPKCVCSTNWLNFWFLVFLIHLFCYLFYFLILHNLFLLFKCLVVLFAFFHCFYFYCIFSLFLFLSSSYIVLSLVIVYFVRFTRH